MAQRADLGGTEGRNLRRGQGFDLGGRGFLNISADYFTSDFVDRADDDWRPQFPTGDSRNQTIGNSWSKWGNGSRESWSALLNGLIASWPIFIALAIVQALTFHYVKRFATPLFLLGVFLLASATAWRYAGITL